jgi:hypothetical protein
MRPCGGFERGDGRWLQQAFHVRKAGCPSFHPFRGAAQAQVPSMLSPFQQDADLKSDTLAHRTSRMTSECDQSACFEMFGIWL